MTLLQEKLSIESEDKRVHASCADDTMRVIEQFSKLRYPVRVTLQGFYLSIGQADEEPGPMSRLAESILNDSIQTFSGR